MKMIHRILDRIQRLEDIVYDFKNHNTHSEEKCNKRFEIYNSHLIDIRKELEYVSNQLAERLSEVISELIEEYT